MAIKVCIDAGHYGNYNPSPVVPGYYEANMVWKLHLLQKKYLESYGIQVIVITTRSNQTADRDLYGRGVAAAGCDLFLSDHSNACGTESVDRAVVIGTLNGKAAAIGRKLLQVIAETMGTKDAPQYSTRAQSDGRDWYGVLRGAAAVGVGGLILEHSFHTNRRAAQWLMDDNNLDKLARAEADCIAAHFGLTTQTPTVPADKPADVYRVRTSWNDGYAGQIGAYKVLASAKAMADDNPGYNVYDTSGKAIYTTQGAAQPPETVTPDEVPVTGVWDIATTRATQEFFDVSVDGIISGQPADNKPYLYAADHETWEFVPQGPCTGSNTIRRLQRFTGAGQDGYMGRLAVIALQTKLRSIGLYKGAIDGSMGPETVKAWQTYLNKH